MTAAGYGTFLSQDVAFDAAEGSLEQIGPTQRLGMVLHAETKPWAWLYASSSVTFVQATLTKPPPATPENPAPAFKEGQLLPYVPPWVLRADVGVDGPLVRWGEDDTQALGGRIGVGFQYLSERPLPNGQRSEQVMLLDASASLRWRWLEVGVEAFNLLNLQYAASEYSFVSDWQTRAVPSLLPARHLSAGAPLTVLATVGLQL